MLQTLGCDRAQGYLLARPMPADELISLLMSWSRLIGGCQPTGELLPDSTCLVP